MHYRAYLIGADDHVKAGQWFLAESKAEAIAMCDMLYESCDDAFRACEVWNGPERLHRSETARKPVDTLDAVTERRQQLFVEMEEMLITSFSCVSSSRKLLDRLNTMKLGHLAL